MNKLSFGLLVGTAVLSMVGCRGLIHPDADTSDLGNEIPKDTFRVLTFEGTLEDQYGDAPTGGTLTNEYSTDWFKFGTKSLTTDGTSSNIGYISYSNLWEIDKNLLMAEWIKIIPVTGTLSIFEFTYYTNTAQSIVDIDVIAILTSESSGYFRLTFSEKEYTSTVRQNITITSDTVEFSSEGQVFFIGFLTDFNGNTISLVVNESVYSEDLELCTITEIGASTDAFRFYYRNYDGIISCYIDQALYAVGEECNIDLLLNYYISGKPWNTTYSYADQIIKPASGGKIQLAGETVAEDITANNVTADTMTVISGTVGVSQPFSWQYLTNIKTYLYADTGGGGICNDTTATSELIYLRNSTQSIDFYAASTKALEIYSTVLKCIPALYVASNKIQIGNTGISYLTPATTWGTASNRIAFTWSSPYIYGHVDNANAVVVGNASDYRLKTNIKELDASLDKIMQLRPISFNPVEIDGKINTEKTEIGLVAHEVQAVRPSVVTGEKDGVTKDGVKQFQSVNYAGLVPDLIKSVQELVQITNEQAKRIKLLEQKLDDIVSGRISEKTEAEDTRLL